jgi:integrase
MKAARAHRIPLAGAALSILQAVLPDDPDAAALIFPGASGHKPLSDVALAKLLPPNVTCHGFRSSFRTWAGERTTYAREVVEMALAHRLGDAVEQAYARGDLFQRRRRLMAEWAAYCAGEAPVDSRVVEFAGARA